MLLNLIKGEPILEMLVSIHFKIIKLCVQDRLIIIKILIIHQLFPAWMIVLIHMHFVLSWKM